ncbi:hypothetical protein JCM3770_006113 [Rhodotorula araucariae]
MRALALLATVASLAVATASTSPAPLPADATPVSPPSDITLDKRAFCFFGRCIGGKENYNYNTDVNNCGSRGNRCSTSWRSGGGAQCINGVCAPTYCNTLHDYNWETRTCQDVSSDTNNCGKCGQTCSVSDATGTQCVRGQCYATSCAPGYSLVSGTCTKNIDTSSDVNNCGSIGNKCPSSYFNGRGSKCASGVCQPESCNSGFQFDYSIQKCRDTNSDPNNCGAVGTKCAFPNGIGLCKSGQCSFTDCNAGYRLSIDGCTPRNWWTDVNNCGRPGLVCSFANGVAKCSSGRCQLDSCNDGYALKTSTFLWWSSSTCQPISCRYGFVYDSSSGTCRNVQSDVNNCGAVGNVCPSRTGTAVCTRGQCSMSSCNVGLSLVDGVCKRVNTNTDPKNCGAIGRVCPTSYANGGWGSCLNGVCQTVCNPLYDFDSQLGFCRDVSSDTNNCGKLGQKCDLPGALAMTCRQGQCYATRCKYGYGLSSDGKCSNVDTTSDVNNCGAVGKACQFWPSGATGICRNSQCQTTGCPSGYSLIRGVCVKQTASQRARVHQNHKKDAIQHAKKTLCPGANEEACPILGSAIYEQAVEHHFQAASEFSGVMLGAGGYECLDTTQSLESCGGCASTGEGVDCTKIRGAQGVGCETGKCVVFSCEQGWRPSPDGDQCVRAHAPNRDGPATNTTAHVARAAKRRIHAWQRYHLHHGSSHGSSQS